MKVYCGGCGMELETSSEEPLYPPAHMQYFDPAQGRTVFLCRTCTDVLRALNPNLPLLGEK